MATRSQQQPELELARLTARVDQVLALVAQAAKVNAANRQLVDVCLDVRNTLTPGRTS